MMVTARQGSVQAFFNESGRVNPPGPPPFESSFVNNFKIVGQGPGNNYLVHENFHVTVSTNGDVTALHDNLTIDCK